ncbi:DUF4602 domain-containing protein [archaeon]|nr:MAG: DUF4602 domain-containing protein [archaeon]
MNKETSKDLSKSKTPIQNSHYWSYNSHVSLPKLAQILTEYAHKQRAEAMVTTVVCPEDKLPEFFRPPKRNADELSSRRQAGGPDGNKKPRLDANKKEEDTSNMSTREELKHLMKSIKQFNSNQLFGKEKRKSYQDKLTELGAMPLKQQKVPFKMKLAIHKSRERKQERKKEEQKQSGVVTMDTLKHVRDRKKSRKGK